jgi:hypothetical protein
MPRLLLVFLLTSGALDGVPAASLHAARAAQSPTTSPSRPAAADPRPAFSQQVLAAHVHWLAAAEREGRGVGTQGLQDAADYIASAFQAAGLRPGGENGTWFQAVVIAEGPDGKPARGVNVVGFLPAPGGDHSRQWVLASAHYDHLGRGWPLAHREHAGAVHPGADDNASGVAVLLELARVLASAAPPRRAVVFAAFTAEEAGLQGSRAFVERPTPFALDTLSGVVNLDTVGRLGSGSVSVLGTSSGPDWPEIFHHASAATGIGSTLVSGNDEASDQRAFIERGIPAVQMFTGPHPDYHRPTDTADKVDVAGLATVATLVRDVLGQLTGRAALLTKTAPPTVAARAPGGQAPAGSAERRISFGVVPDFAFHGSGVRASDVTAGSPAAAAGLKAGDVITRIEQSSIRSLQEFSSVLRTLVPGQRVTVVVERNGHEQTLAVTVAAR